MSINKITLNGVDYPITASDASPEVAEHKITIEYGTVLENTRWNNATQATVNGYTTYLIPMENVPQQLVKCIQNDVPYSGLYTYSDGTYTSTATVPNAQEFKTMYPDSNYTGWFVSTNQSIDWEFYTGIDVITVGDEECDRLGFKGVSSGYFPFVTAHNGYPAIKFPMTDNAVYLMDLQNVAFLNYWYRKSETATAKNNTWATFETITDGNRLFISSIADCISYGVFRPAWASANIVNLCKRGIYLYKLKDFGAVDRARKKLPVKLIGHGTNFLPNFMQSMANGWSGSEFDLRKTSDGIYIFSHEVTVNGVNVETSDYETVKSAIPWIMTLDEMLEFLSQFDDAWVDYHFSGVGDAEERMDIIRKTKAHDINVGYYVGITGDIGNQSANTFYKTGVAYGFAFNSAGNAHAPTSNDDPMVYKYFVYAGQDKLNPYLYNMVSDTGNASYESIASGAFDGYQFAQLYYDTNIIYPH